MANLKFFDAVDRALQAFARDRLYTAIPAVVVNVDKLQSEQVVDVLPTIGRLYEDGQYLDPATVFNAPVCFPAGGGGFITFPVKRGDVVLLVFSQRDTSNWRASEGRIPTKPKTPRSHALTDAMVFPCLGTAQNNANVNPDDVEIKFAGSNILLKANGDIEVNAAKDLIATAVGKAEVTAPVINLIGDVTITGKLDVNGSEMNHNGTNVGEGHNHDDSGTYNISGTPVTGTSGDPI